MSKALEYLGNYLSDTMFGTDPLNLTKPEIVAILRKRKSVVDRKRKKDGIVQWQFQEALKNLEIVFPMHYPWFLRELGLLQKFVIPFV